MSFEAVRFRRARAAVLFLALLAAPAAAAKRPITETDLFKFIWITDPQISPDGRQVVFTRVTVNEKKDGYDTALWIASTDGGEPPRSFTSGPRDSSPRWSPDGTRIVFSRSAEKDGKRQPAQLFLIPTRGGEAVALTDMPDGAGGPVWSPDGKTIAFGNSAREEDLKKWREARAKGKETTKEPPAEDKKKDEEKAGEEEKRESDVRVITRAVYRFNGGGYDDPTRIGHIWTVAVPAGGFSEIPEPKQLTKGALGEGGPVWSPDGSKIYFYADVDKEPYYSDPDNDLYVIPAGGGEMKKVVDIDGPVGDIAISPDGKRIAFTGFLNPEAPHSYNQSDLFVVDATPGAQARNLTARYEGEIQDGLAGDQHAPRGGRPQPLVWSQDGRWIYTVTGERGRVNMTRFDAAGGAIEPVTQGPQEIASYTATPDASRMAMVVSTALVIGDLQILDTASGRVTTVARPNQELFDQLDLTAPEEITYKSFDGREIHAFVQKPPGFDAKKKYPVILNIHGGPHAAYGHTFFHEMHWMAAKGYVVIYPNPRGSSGYGEELGNIIQYEFPGDDAKDLVAGVDELIRRGYVDPKRQGVTGGSGGGILTNWIVTQTDRFQAAVSQRSIADWTSFWYTADFWLYRPTWFRGAPWEEPEDFARRSPITHADKIKTPLMLIEGEADLRTPPAAGGEMMFRALKYMKKPTVMVRFPDESHELSRSGQPWHRIERLRHIVAWFDKYLMGKETIKYDLP
ncbi:MAG TPA: S9 family peptidase [Thermoanaerobaculia bacterium]